jgi:hypothetical protein|tara:strand:+ start:506 stop:1000 length:495 start_codon:yes stop_codon:yes gene_type:complete
MNINYKEYVVSPQAAARARKESLNKDLKNSIRGRENGYVARLGEIAVAQATGGTIKNTYDYDVVLKNGTKVDVKTKERTVDPKPHFEVSVADFNTTQKCDAYYFVSVNTKSSPNTVSIVGWLSKDDFYKKAKFWKKGQIDFNSENKFEFKADCYNMECRYLNSL